MRFQVVSLPHTQTTAEYSNCAFATLTRRFCDMMTSLGHEVILYSGEDNDASVAEHVTCISKAEQAEIFNVREPNDILKHPLDHIMYDPEQPWWRFWNSRVGSELGKRVQRKDFLCLIGGGLLFEQLISAYPQTMPVEYAVGYAGISDRTHVAYGSDNWRHVVYGIKRYKDWRGRFYDRTIPHYFDPGEFEYRGTKDGYLLYLGKLKEDKGVHVAERAAWETGQDIIFAGQGPSAEDIQHGEVRNRYIGPDERRELLAGAKALFVPSLYTEPFGMIAVEGLLSGTPLITTPFGGLGEINEDGVTGFHCNTMQDFVLAANSVSEISPGACRKRGMKYDMATVKHQYQRWFDDLTGLWDEGWGALPAPRELVGVDG